MITKTRFWALVAIGLAVCVFGIALGSFIPFADYVVTVLVLSVIRHYSNAKRTVLVSVFYSFVTLLSPGGINLIASGFGIIEITVSNVLVLGLVFFVVILAMAIALAGLGCIAHSILNAAKMFDKFDKIHP